MAEAFNPKKSGRELAFQFLFQWITTGQPALPESDLEMALEFFSEMYVDEQERRRHLDQKAKKFALELIAGSLKNYQELSEKIKSFVKLKNLAHSNNVDQAILLLGSFEIIKTPSTPFKVVINEAVNLAKIYGGPESQSFINAVLDNMAKNRENKTE